MQAKDWKRIMHKSSLLIFYVDEQDTTRQTKLKSEMADGIKNRQLFGPAFRPTRRHHGRHVPVQYARSPAQRVYATKTIFKFLIRS